MYLIDRRDAAKREVSEMEIKRMVELVVSSEDFYDENIEVLTLTIENDGSMSGDFRDLENQRVFEFVIDGQDVSYKPRIKGRRDSSNWDNERTMLEWDNESRIFLKQFPYPRFDAAVSKRVKKPKCGGTSYNCGKGCVNVNWNCRINKKSARGKQRLEKLQELAKQYKSGNVGSKYAQSNKKVGDIQKERDLRASELRKQRDVARNTGDINVKDKVKGPSKQREEFAKKVAEGDRANNATLNNVLKESVKSSEDFRELIKSKGSRSKEQYNRLTEPQKKLVDTVDYLQSGINEISGMLESSRLLELRHRDKDNIDVLVDRVGKEISSYSENPPGSKRNELSESDKKTFQSAVSSITSQYENIKKDYQKYKSEPSTTGKDKELDRLALELGAIEDTGKPMWKKSKSDVDLEDLPELSPAAKKGKELVEQRKKEKGNDRTSEKLSPKSEAVAKSEVKSENVKYTENLIMYWTKQYNELDYKADELEKKGKTESAKSLRSQMAEMDKHISGLQQELKDMTEVQPEVKSKNDVSLGTVAKKGQSKKTEKLSPTAQKGKELVEQRKQEKESDRSLEKDKELDKLALELGAIEDTGKPMWKKSKGDVDLEDLPELSPMAKKGKKLVEQRKNTKSINPEEEQKMIAEMKEESAKIEQQYKQMKQTYEGVLSQLKQTPGNDAQIAAIEEMMATIDDKYRGNQSKINEINRALSKKANSAGEKLSPTAQKGKELVEKRKKKP